MIEARAAARARPSLGLRHALAEALAPPGIDGSLQARLMRSVHPVRVVIALSALAASPFLPASTAADRRTLLLLIASAYLPYTVAVLAASRRFGSRWLGPAATAGDVLLVFLFQTAVPPARTVALFGYILIAALYASIGGLAGGLIVGGVAAALTVLAQALNPGPPAIDGFTLTMFAASLGSLAVILGAATREQRRANAELARLHEKSEAVLARVGDGVVVTDAAGTIVQWNKSAERIAECPSHSAIGRTCGAVLGLRLDEGELDCSGGCALLALKDSTAVLEVTRVLADGRRQPLLADVATLRSSGGEVSEVVHSFRDITRLREADEAKTLFLATASHELKTPLTVIQGFAKTLLVFPDLGPQDRETALRAIERRAVQLNGIVDRLLLSSRIEMGRVQVVHSRLDLPPILEERADRMSAATGRQIVREIAPGLPPALGGLDALTIVVDHLLDNAVKYSPEGGPIGVRATADARRVTVSVSDSGIGMDDEQRALCFEKFWQAESSEARRFAGTGIGLYIVRSLVEAMGGEIRVESAPMQGSTFTVSLVRAEPAGTAVPAPAGVAEPSLIDEFMRQMGIRPRRQA